LGRIARPAQQPERFACSLSRDEDIDVRAIAKTRIAVKRLGQSHALHRNRRNAGFTENPEQAGALPDEQAIAGRDHAPARLECVADLGWNTGTSRALKISVNQWHDFVDACEAQHDAPVESDEKGSRLVEV